jgi:hypothetical protein
LYHRLAVVLNLFAVTTTLPAQSAGAGYFEPSGSFKTGRLSFHWKDATRPELETKAAGDARELMVHVFYPAAPRLSESRAVYLPDSDALRGSWSAAVLNRLQALHSFSYEGAPIAAGRFPVAVFLPGGGMKALMNQTLIEDLVSHGWVVAAIDPPYNAPVRFPDGRVLGDIAPTSQGWPAALPDSNLAPAERMARIETKRQNERERMTHWARDVSFVIDQLAVQDTLPSGPFTQKLDLTRGVGVFGHSLGGIAAGTARLIEPRVRAGINLDGWGFDGAFSEIKGGDMGARPFLWILRKSERSYPDRRELEPITDGALRVNLNRPEFSHGDFTDDAFWGETATSANRPGRVRGITEVRLWVRAFFAATIVGRHEDLQRLVSRPQSSTPTTVTAFRSFSRK